MKRHSGDDQHGGPNGADRVSSATREDLASAVADLAEAERLRSRAVASLARVRARGDGEAAVGMPVEQHLRWNTNVRRGTVTTIGVITDVADELPCVTEALEVGTITLDQAGAVAWPAAKVTREVRRSLDASLTEDEGWKTLAPEALEFEVSRMLEELAPPMTPAQELEKAQRQYLRTQATLDGQGIKGEFQAHGLDAAFINATLDAATARPEATEPDPDGVLVGKPTRRAHQLFEGLKRIFRAFNGRGNDAGPDVTIYAIVDETEDGAGTGEVLTARRGLAPRLSAAAVRDLEAAGAKRVEVFAVDRELVAVKGRRGHAINDPDGLSEDTTRILVTIRDRTCRMAGCDRPVEHLHHLIPQGHPDSTDAPFNLAGLCQPCHDRVVHRWRWAGTVGALGRVTWHRPATGTTVATLGRLAQRLRKPPPQPPPLDANGDPIPF